MDIEGLLVKPVAEGDDLVAFNFPFMLEGKAIEDGKVADVVHELDDGDLLIEGWAASFEGVDRMNEQFIDGSFQRGIKSFLAGPAAICFHHSAAKVLGKVLELEEVEGKGLRFKGRIDGAIRNHPELGTYYQQVKNGTLSALSVGGFFKRKLTEAGWRIADCDLTEISVTGVPVASKGTSFAVVAGKALADMPVAEIAPTESGLTPEEEASLVNSFSVLGDVFEKFNRPSPPQTD